MDETTIQAPDIAGPIAAWRAWRIVRGRNGYRLMSVLRPTVWEPNAALGAACLRPRTFGWRRRRCRHVAPDAACECGVYGAGLQQVRQYLDADRVIGEVSLWGRVIECERGYRASRAYPRRLFVPLDVAGPRDDDRDDVVLGLACYGIPVLPLQVSFQETVERLTELRAA